MRGMKGPYPEIRVYTEHGIITVHKRPGRYELKENERLTGEYRVPVKGEYYWYPFDAHSSNGPLMRDGRHDTGRVAKCSGVAKNRYHIINKILPKVAVLDDAGTWIAVPIEEMKTIVQGD